MPIFGIAAPLFIRISSRKVLGASQKAAKQEMAYIEFWPNLWRLLRNFDESDRTVRRLRGAMREVAKARAAHLIDEVRRFTGSIS